MSAQSPDGFAAVSSRSFSRLLVACSGLLLFACAPGDVAGPGEAPGFSGSPGAVISKAAPAPFVADVCGEQTFRLLADQNIDVGTVTIANDEGVLYVVFETTNGWAMSDARVSVTTDPDDVPMAGKQVTPGLFPFGETLDPTETLYPLQIPLSVLGGATEAVVAAYAKVSNGESTEGAWIEGDRIRERGNWATYASYGLADCDAGGEVVGPAGGTIDGGDYSLVVPAGALAGDVEITVSPVTDGLPEGVLPGTAFDLGPEGTTFDPPATLTLHYDDTGMSAEDEQSLAIQHLRADGVIEALPSVVDAAANTVTAEISHFSVYAVVPGIIRMLVRSIPESTAGDGSLIRHVVSLQNLGTTVIPASAVTVDLTLTGPLASVTNGYLSSVCSLVTDPTPPGTLHYTCAAWADLNPGSTFLALDFRDEVLSGSSGATIQATASFAYDTWAGTAPTLSMAVVDPILTDVYPDVEPPLDNEFRYDMPRALTIDLFNDGPGDLVHADVQVDLYGTLVPGEIVPPANCSFLVTLDSDFDGIDDGARFQCRQESLLPSLSNSSFTFTLTPRSVFPASEITILANISEVLGTTDPNAANDLVFTAFPVF